jgi:hypothetical protein
MKKIYKYQLDLLDTQFVELSLGAEILTVQMQGNQLCLWAMVNTLPEAIKKNRRIEIIGTGNPVPIGDLKYISTFQMFQDWGTLTYHVFENI